MRNRAAYRILFTPNSPATHATRNSIHDFKRNTVILSIRSSLYQRRDERFRSLERFDRPIMIRSHSPIG